MTLQQFFRIVEIRTKIVSVSTFSIAVLYTLYATGSFSWLLLGLMAAAVLMVDMGTTAFNIYFDYLRGVDHADYEREKEKVLVYEGVAPGTAFLTGAALFGGAAVLGLIIAFLTGWQVAAAGALCMAVGFFYTGGPRPISTTPVGELFAGGFLGTALFLITFFVFAGHMAVHALMASLPSFFLIASILTVNNTCDIEGDRASGRYTFSIVAGRRTGEIAVYVLGALGYGSVAALALTGVFPWWAAVAIAAAAVPAVIEYRRMHRRGFIQATKGPSMGSISKIFALYTLAMWLSLGLGIGLGG